MSRIAKRDKTAFWLKSEAKTKKKVFNCSQIGKKMRTKNDHQLLLGLSIRWNLQLYHVNIVCSPLMTKILAADKFATLTRARKNFVTVCWPDFGHP